MSNIIQHFDPEVAALIKSEWQKQSTNIRLIASENYESIAVQEAYDSPFGNKYSEGYPYKWKGNIKVDEDGRYYNGQVNTNSLENLAIKRALSLFCPGNEENYHANVQSLSGAPANLAVLNAFLDKDDKFLGLSLDYGGHLTHGHKVSATSKFFSPIQYKLNDQNLLDYDQIRGLALKHRPKLIFSGATAYARTIDFKAFGEIAKESGALLVADISHISGLVATGQHPHPFPHADIITSTTHKILRGPRGALIISRKELGPAIDKSVFPGLFGGPHMNTICALTVALKEALSPEYSEYTKQVVRNAKVLANHMAAAGFKIVGNGTDNHMILVDVKRSVPEVAIANGGIMADLSERANIVFNKNAVPGDEKPWVPSGIRLGTPAVTSLGMKEDQMIQIASWIGRVAMSKGNTQIIHKISDEVESLMKQFPVPRKTNETLSPLL